MIALTHMTFFVSRIVPTNSDTPLKQEAVLEGGRISFGCLKPPTPTSSQRWRRGNDDIYIDDTFVTSEKWTSRKFELENKGRWYNLTLNSASASDATVYSCFRGDPPDETRVSGYQVSVLRRPSCSNATRLNLVTGDDVTVTCESDVEGATLLWHMGEEGERLVGENLLKDEGSESGGDGAGTERARGYRTAYSIDAQPEMNGKFVYCELQHPTWHVLDGSIECKIGPLNVSFSVEVKCKENRLQKGESHVDTNSSVSCLISSNPLSLIKENEIRWEVDQGGGYVDLKVKPIVKRLDHPEQGFLVQVNLVDVPDHNNVASLRLKAGDVTSDEIVLGPKRKMAGDLTLGLVIGIAVAILISSVVFASLVVMYRKGLIFRREGTNEIEMEKTKAENRLLAPAAPDVDEDKNPLPPES